MENNLKAISSTADELRVGNYIVLFGGRDLTGTASRTKNKDGSKGEYFTAKTDFESEYTKTGMLYVDFEHGQDPDQTGITADDVLGYVDWKTARVDSAGVFVERVLNRRMKYVQWIEELIKAGLVGNSTEAIPALVEKKADGEITKWALRRDTLTVNPMEPRMLSQNTMQAMKALMEVMPNLKSVITAQADNTTPATEPRDPAEAAQAAQGDGEETADKSNKEFITMDAKELQDLLDARDAKKAAEAEAKAKADADLVALVEEKANAKLEAYKAEAAKGRRLPFNQQAPAQAQFNGKYDNYSAPELALAIHLGQSLTSANTQGRDVRFPDSAYKALAIKLIEDKEDYGNRDLSPEYSQSAMKAAGMSMDKDAYKAATDPMLTTGTTDGGNWVHTAYGRELWAKIRAEAKIVAMIPTQIIPDGSKSSTLPIEGTDFTWYSAPEVSATNATTKQPLPLIDGSQITTPTNKEITVAKMGARGLYSAELTEDSILAVVPQMRDQLVKSGAEYLEHAVIDGDVQTTNVNINAAGGTAPVSTGTARDLFLMFDGFRKLALITNAANSRAGGALDEDDYLETMWMLGTAGLGGADLNASIFIVDPNVYKASLKLASLKTKDVWANATLQSGVLTSLWGYSLFPSWFMHFKSTSRKANATGEVDLDDQTQNTTGSILSVRKDQWKFAYKRQMTIETTRIPSADAYEIVAWARVGLGYRDTEASSITYGITV